MPWRRPGFQLGLDIAAIKAANPKAVGCILGGHGVTAWGNTSERCEKNSLWIIRTAERYLRKHSKKQPFGARLKRFEPLPATRRRQRAAELAPLLRGVASQDRPMVGHFTDDQVVLDFLASRNHPRLAALGTSCPDHFLRTKVKPMLLDLPPGAPLDKVRARVAELHEAYRDDYRGYYERNAQQPASRRRSAAPTR